VKAETRRVNGRKMATWNDGNKINGETLGERERGRIPKE